MIAGAFNCSICSSAAFGLPVTRKVILVNPSESVWVPADMICRNANAVKGAVHQPTLADRHQLLKLSRHPQCEDGLPGFPRNFPFSRSMPATSH